jgi:Flp pilus assembly protein CpaB
MVRRTIPRRSLVLILAAVACGSAAFVVVAAAADRAVSAAVQRGGTVAVVVATGDAPRGTVLSGDDVEVARRASGSVPPGATSSAGEVVGRRLLTDVAPGEVIGLARLAPRPSGPVAALVPPGLRGVTIPTSLPEGLVVPGDRVDVLATYGGRPHTETAASELEVLRVLRGAAGVGGAGDTGVTLVVLADEQDAERLAFASAFADLSVSVHGVTAGPATTWPPPSPAPETPAAATTSP